MLDLIKKIVGTKNDREIKRIRPYVERINSLEPDYQKLTDAELRGKTDEFKKRLQEATAELRQSLEDANAETATGDAEQREEFKSRLEELDKQTRQAEKEALEELLPEAFAAVRESSRRSIGLRHFDVQMIGGVVLHEGTIAEMRTGEGKTLVATLPLYLNALTGRGTHLITVNDYLARRDVQWMGPIYYKLGLSVASIVHEASYLFDPTYLTKDYRYLNLRPITRQQAYQADITYGTNNEFGFDYLRDNMKFSLEEYVQRELNFAVVDEVDNILIDEARTPLIISGPAEESTDKYYVIDRIIPKLERGAVIQGDPLQEDRAAVEKQGDYTVDEKSRSVTLTETGVAKVERLLGVHNLYDPRQIDTLHHVQQALKAHAIFKRDVDYVVKDGEVIIVDEFTGRLMPGRRWSDGLHQAVEAKEGVKIERENQTLATVTFQNYFRMYKKLAGMTGTADTEAVEFHQIYDLEVMVIPTNRDMIRIDHHDSIYKTEGEKFDAVIEEIRDCHERGQTGLVGTTSIEKSERLSDLLKKKGIKHVVLNAKYHEKEAEIVAQAGRKGMVTIATNMAGRGTDILLGGNAEFMAKQECVKKGIAQQLRAAQGKIQIEVDESKSTVWYYAGNEYAVPTDQWNEALARYKQQTDVEHDGVTAAGGLHILGTERHEARGIDNQLRGRAGRQGDPGSSRFYLSLEDDLMRIFAKQWVSTLLQRLGMEEGVPIESKLITKRIEAAQKAVEAQNFEARKHLLEYDDVMNKQREAVYGLRRQLLEGVDQKDLILEDYVADILTGLLDQYAAKGVHPEDWNIKGMKDAIFTRFGVD